MGGKDPRANESNRPESGGADRDMMREKSGLLERDKQKFAEEESEARRAAQTEAEQSRSTSSDFSIDNEPEPDSRA